MKAKARVVRSSPPLLMKAKHESTRHEPTQAAGFAVDFQDLCAQEMDRALGIHKATLDSAVQLHSCAIEMYQALDPYRNTSWFVPVFESFIDAVAQSFAHCMKLHAHCMEMHRTWVALLAPNAFLFREASTFMSHTAARADELAYHMDIAIGEQHVEETLAGHAGRRAGRAAQEAESDMDIAMGLRAA